MRRVKNKQSGTMAKITSLFLLATEKEAKRKL